MSTKVDYPKTLFNQSLLKLAYDDVVFLHLPRIKGAHNKSCLDNLMDVIVFFI